MEFQMPSKAEIAVLFEFINAQGIVTPSPDKFNSVDEAVDEIYDKLSDDTLRSLANHAVQECNRNSNNSSLGLWESIIDSIRNTTMMRRERATTNVTTMHQFSSDDSPQNLIRFLRNLHKNGETDKEFQLILSSAYSEYTSKVSSEDNIAAFYNFALSVVDRLTPPSETVSKASIPHSNIIISSEHQEHSISSDALLLQGNVLNEFIASTHGDAAKLRDLLCDYVRNNDCYVEMKSVLVENIKACERANYTNKLKLFRFLLTAVNEIQTIPASSMHSDDSLKQYHAPKFIDKVTDSISISPLCPPSFIDGSVLSSHLLSQFNGLKNNKKKYEKRFARSMTKEIYEGIAEHLKVHHWAVCDGFIDNLLVQRVRREIEQFTKYYEQSEIWVGKVAEVGAQISVPSVRGDSVLWVCGGHPQGLVAPETMGSRYIKSKGEVEPCRLDVKASAPIKKFLALKELITACDKFIMEEMKSRVEDLNGIYERSDCMMAIYPGHGSRFANHIDNTTGDGRVLTVVMYLNRDWKLENGGALRITLNDGVVDVSPLSGRIVMFYSAEIPHEVLPTYDRDRHAITIWYYDVNERAKALEQASKSGKGSAAAKSSLKSQSEVKAFMTELMGKDANFSDLPSVEEIHNLSKRIKELSNDAVEILANITGSPNAMAFVEGFNLLTPSDLIQMRQLFHRMGLQ